MAYIQSTRPWWYTSEMTPRPASHICLSSCMNMRRTRLSTTGTDVWSMPRCTPHPQASPLTEPTIQDLHQQRLDNNHQDQMHYHRQDNNNSPNVTIHATQLEPTIEIKPKRIIFHHTSITIMPAGQGRCKNDFLH